MGLTPVFGRVFDTILVPAINELYLVCEELITETFCNHFHSYEVLLPRRPSFRFCNTSNLVDHNVLGIYNISNTLYVTLKYHILEKI